MSGGPQPRTPLGGPARAIVETRRLGRGLLELQLQCGHRVRRRFLSPPPRVICPHCGRGG